MTPEAEFNLLAQSRANELIIRTILKAFAAQHPDPSAWLLAKSDELVASVRQGKWPKDTPSEAIDAIDSAIRYTFEEAAMGMHLAKRDRATDKNPI